ncbi:MAG: hypothetical protein PHY93_21615 [Bacteriovorax sp.]|nr:hypothetical protein [Bacteriovorax sp.]
MKKIFLAILFYSFAFSNLYASFIASNKAKLDSDLPTHVLIAGNPDKIGELFVYSLLTKAKIYLEKSPNEQIIIIGRSDDKNYIKDAGFQVLDSKLGLLKSGVIKDAIRDIKYISSIDIYAHSNALSGVSLDSNSWVYQLMNEKDDLWDLIANKINKSSFIFIHGCNAGIKLAPMLASKLKIAVLAALTSTDFQYIYKNSFWTFDTNSDEDSKSDSNTMNYSKSKSCGMYCTRMRPDNSSYKGHWGDWTGGGYPAYKLFCGSNENERCELGALEAIFSFPSIMKYDQTKLDLQNFKNQLIEFMCPFAFNPEKQLNCRLNLENALISKTRSAYSPFKGKTLVCDRVKCKAHFNCSSLNASFNPANCSLESETDKESTSFADEYIFFISTYNKYFNK